ncbi:hypothetical protein BCR39DRAFT_523772 [Naematelia encephala]|uniref:Uncharacterized protein n=1 Tax=Naematelia encephala TaxID=71784 RepID=A0A1Y2BCM5_9TREE|nr:hypothetical protein BCR39DRAFT_523772 [Naematelia encephala]
MSTPAWQTDDLVEEWVESSPSPRQEPSPLPTEAVPKLDYDSVRAKRGSLRALGHAAARALPPSRSASAARIISGHGEGLSLTESVNGVNQANNMSSPPSSDGEAVKKDGGVGTFVVKDGVEDDRGAGLANRGKKGKDMFGPTPLEKMFQPPSPPTNTPVAQPTQQDMTVSTTPTQPPRIASEETRRVSHPYAPANPSRLSKSVTPSSDGSSSFSAPASTHSTHSEHAADHVANGDANAVSPLQQNREFSFSYPTPRQLSMDNVHGGTRSTAKPASDQESFNAMADVEASQSTIHNPRRTRSNPLSSHGGSSKTPLKLFRSTYDTYTRQHLSALADSFALEPQPGGTDLRDWSPDASDSPGFTSSSHSRSSRELTETDESQRRSSKRMRMSPRSPPRAPRSDGVEVASHRLRGMDIGETSRDDQRYDEGPTIEYPTLPPTPPLEGGQTNRATHRSNPSTTSSSYLRAAEELMERIRARSVSLTPSESSSNPPGRKLSEIEEQSEAATHSEWERFGDNAPGAKHAQSSYMRNAEELMERIQARSVSLTNSDSPSPPHRGLSEIGEQSEASSPTREGTETRPQQSQPAQSRYILAAEELMDRIRAREVSLTASETSNTGRYALSEIEKQPNDGTNSAWRRTEHETKSDKRRNGTSPRRMLRRLSASEEVKRVFDGGESEGPSPTSPTYGTGVGPRPPSAEGGQGSVPSEEVADDLGRFISATTFPTSTTISTSFVKHAGPRHRPVGKAMKVIRPDEVEGIMSERVGRMRYDKTTMRWVRESSLGKVDEVGEEATRGSGSGGSEDVFAGMESWGVEPPIHVEQDGSSSEDEQSERVANTTHIAPVIDDLSSESDSDTESIEAEDPPSPPARPLPVHANSAPAVMTPMPAPAPPRPIRSALRNGAGSLTPGIKKKMGWHESVTPAGGSSGRRSVSFSDGKKNGKILGVDKVREGDLFDEKSAGESSRSWAVSTRTKRIQGVLEEMEELSLEDATPSKPPRPTPDNPDLTLHSANTSRTEEGDSTVRLAGPSFRHYHGAKTYDQTFLTECSFGVAHDRLVQLITDVYGAEPWWEGLTSLDLHGKGVEGLQRLSEFLPALDEVWLSDNKISYLSGIPSGVRTLHVASNRLTSLTSVAHLANLQYLDVSNNKLDSLAQLSCLKHLRELCADRNQITELDGVLEMDCLIKLSVAGNKIDRVDLARARWAKLEALDLSKNRISSLTGLERLTNLNSLDIGSNRLTELRPSRPVTPIRTLRLSDNDLDRFDISFFPKVRTLYADGNRLHGLERSDGTGGRRLESLSLRNQRVESFKLTLKDLENVKRLYISGNTLSSSFFPSVPLYALIYLEAAACKLSAWPSDFTSRLPNLKILNVNYNFLADLDGVRGLRGLRKLTVVGNRLGGSGPGAVAGLHGLTSLEEIDLRMNPSTLGFYLPLLLPVSSTRASDLLDPSPRKTPTPFNMTAATILPPGHTSSSSAPSEWQDLDAHFRRNLPDEWYAKRMVYRGLLMRAVGNRLRVLDGIEVGVGERKKAERLLDIAGKRVMG